MISEGLQPKVRKIAGQFPVDPETKIVWLSNRGKGNEKLENN